MRVEAAREPSPVPGISRNVFLLGIVSFLTDTSTEMLYPLIPLFLTAVLGAPVSVVGLIEGVAEAVASFFKGVSGWLSDRTGLRRPLVLAGYGLAALTKPLLALAAGWPLVLAARVLDRFGKGLRGTPRDALIADSTEAALRGRAFGFHRSADQSGAVLGPLLALPLLALFDNNFRAVFVTAFVPGAAAVLMLLLVRETGGGRQGGARTAALRWGELPPGFRRFLLVALVFAAGNSSDAFLILRARQLGLDTRQVVLAFALQNAVYVAAAWPAGALSDRLGRKRLLVAALAVFALVYLAFGLAPVAAWVWPLFAAYGLYLGLSDGIARAFVVDLAGPDRRATGLGLHAMAAGLAAFPASVLAGLLWDAVGPAAPFFYGASTAALSAALLAAVVPGRRCASEPGACHEGWLK